MNSTVNSLSPNPSAAPRAEGRALDAGARAVTPALWRKTFYRLLPWLVPIGLLIVWDWLSSRGIVAEQILPAPQVVYATFLDLAQSGELWLHLAGSLLRVAKAYAFAALFGVALGALLGASRRVAAYVAPSFEFYAQTPVIAWIPIALMLFGISETLAVVLIAIAALVPVVVNTWKGVSNIPLAYVEVARAYRLNAWQSFRTVALPAALPQILVGLRYGLSQAWLTLVAAELIGIDEGVGAMIVQARNLFQIDVMLVGILTLGIVGLVLDKLFVRVETRLLRWRKPGL